MDAPDDRPFGPDAATILATEHWSLLATRSMLWNEATSRPTIFLTVLSASIVALALLAEATGFGPRTTTVALVLLPVVLFLGIGTYVRLVDINTEEKRTVLAMNRLRRAYLEMAPGLEPYFSSGHHDDEAGFLTSYQLASPGDRRPRAHLLIAMPTVDAALAAAIVVLIIEAADTATAAVAGAGAAVFLAVWGALFSLQRRTLEPLRTTPRFPTPPAGR
jgi:hypothetical protein